MCHLLLSTSCLWVFPAYLNDPIIYNCLVSLPSLVYYVWVFPSLVVSSFILFLVFHLRSCLCFPLFVLGLIFECFGFSCFLFFFFWLFSYFLLPACFFFYQVFIKACFFFLHLPAWSLNLGLFFCYNHNILAHGSLSCGASGPRVCPDRTSDHRASHHGRQHPAKPDVTAWRESENGWTPNCDWTQPPKTDWGQFDNRGYSTEVIHSNSDQDCDYRDDKTRQAGMEEVWWGNVERQTKTVGEFYVIYVELKRILIR